MGNRMNTCCRTNMELEDETPPDFNADAPTIPEHLDREFRSKVRFEQDKVRFEQEVQFEPPEKVRFDPPEKAFEWTDRKVSKKSVDVATQARPSIAGFHHETNLCAPQDVAHTATAHTPPAPIGLKVDASVGEGSSQKGATKERSYNGVLDSVLGSVLDRCYLFCYEREWRTWQSMGAVGSKGSRAFSVSQAHALATMDLSEFEDLHLAMVIELDMVPGSISFVGHELSLSNPVSINAVRVVYWLQDFVLVCHNNDGRLEQITDVSQKHGVGVGTGTEEPGADKSSTSEKIAFQEYAWLLDDFDDMMVRRKIVGQEVPGGSSSLEAARMRRKEMEQQRMSSRHHTSYSSRRAGSASSSSSRKPLEETNETLRALRAQPTFPQIAKPRRVPVPASSHDGDGD